LTPVFVPWFGHAPPKSETSTTVDRPLNPRPFAAATLKIASRARKAAPPMVPVTSVAGKPSIPESVGAALFDEQASAEQNKTGARRPRHAELIDRVYLQSR
jgi:hypothetical protein